MLNVRFMPGCGAVHALSVCLERVWPFFMPLSVNEEDDCAAEGEDSAVVVDVGVVGAVVAVAAELSMSMPLAFGLLFSESMPSCGRRASMAELARGGRLAIKGWSWVRWSKPLPPLAREGCCWSSGICGLGRQSSAPLSLIGEGSRRFSWTMFQSAMTCRVVAALPNGPASLANMAGLGSSGVVARASPWLAITPNTPLRFWPRT